MRSVKGKNLSSLWSSFVLPFCYCFDDTSSFFHHQNLFSSVFPSVIPFLVSMIEINDHSFFLDSVRHARFSATSKILMMPPKVECYHTRD